MGNVFVAKTERRQANIQQQRGLFPSPTILDSHLWTTDSLKEYEKGDINAIKNKSEASKSNGKNMQPSVLAAVLLNKLRQSNW